MPRAAAPRDATAATAGDRGLYAAVKARDARFDGRFFVGVTSTGVYCRPVCRVRTPLFRNCRFFGNAASAEHAGFRPCLRCRPELAPGLAFVDSSRSLAHAAARLLFQAVLEGHELAMPKLAARLGVTDRHLRRIFAAEHGVTPLDFITTQRLLHAKQLLTDTTLPVTQVALASGFASVRRFNAAFAERYRLAPSAIRRDRAAAAAAAPPTIAPGADAPSIRAPGIVRKRSTPAAAPAPSGAPTVRLGYRPPYDVSGVVRFMARRAIPGVEWVDEQRLLVARTIGWNHGGERLAGWWLARFVPARNELEVEVAPSLVPVLGAVLQRLRHGFDLEADPALIDPVLAAVPGPATPGVRVPGAVCGFEAAVRVVLGQQVTVAAARTLTKRLADALGEPLPAGVASTLPPALAAAASGTSGTSGTGPAPLQRLFPTAQAVAQANAELIGKLGIVRQRVRALQALATEVAAGRLLLEATSPLEQTLEQLRALPGFGEWTVQLIALRALGWPDAFPATDIGVLDALVPLFGRRDAKAAEAASAAWRPWRGYAVMKLWRSLENE